MKRVYRGLIRFLFGPPDCDLCGQYRASGRLLGSWWHTDGCPGARYERPEGSDNE